MPLHRIFVYIRGYHLEALKALDSGEKISRRVLLELFIQGLVSRDENITEAGRILMRIEPRKNLFIASDTVKEAELYVKTGYLPEEWRRDVESRGLRVEELPLLWEAYLATTPTVLLTPYILSFIEEIPPAGDYDELVELRELGGYGRNVVNAMQAMRLLFISPPKNGKRTYALSGGARRLPDFVLSLDSGILIGEEELRSLKDEVADQKLVAAGLQEPTGKRTSKGDGVLTSMKSREEYIRPVYLSEEEEEALKEIRRIVEKVTDPKERIRKIESGVSETTLRLLQFRGFLDEEYRPTVEGLKAIQFGPVSVEGMRAVVFSVMGDPPAHDWWRRAKDEGLVHRWLTGKAEFYLDMGKKGQRFPLLTRYDVAILSVVPRDGYILEEKLYSKVEERVGAYEKALAEAETKGLIRVFQNDAIRLTEFGKKMKEVVEYANLQELFNMDLIITPESWKIVKILHEREDEVNKIWKKADENRKDYYRELARWLGRFMDKDEEEVLKLAKLLHLAGFLGQKSLTEAGRKLATVLEAKVEGS